MLYYSNLIFVFQLIGLYHDPKGKNIYKSDHSKAYLENQLRIKATELPSSESETVIKSLETKVSKLEMELSEAKV